MRLRTSTIQARHLTPRCLDCGTACRHGAARQRCAGCGRDLQDRAPRSYAEMEGLIEQPVDPAPVDAFRAWRDAVTLERWLLTLFTAAVLLAFGAHALGALLQA